VLLESLEAAPDVDDLRMVRGQEPVDNPEAFEPWIGLAGVAILNRAAYAICPKSLPFWTTGRTSKWVISNIGPLNDGL